MVSHTNGEEINQGTIISQNGVKMFIDEVLKGEGDLSVTENAVCFDSQSEDKLNIQFAYQQITLHAICRDTSNFPYECILCMIERRGIPGYNEDDESNEDSTCDVRFVPNDSSSLQSIYDAIATGQELHPDPEDEDSEEEMYYNDADEAELNSDGQAVLDRLTDRIQMPSQGEFMSMVSNSDYNHKNDDEMAVEDGQFDDVA